MAPSKAIPVAALLVMLGVGAVIGAEPSPTVNQANPDWPCIQHKVATLTSAQMWDGPPVDDVKGWQDNEEIGKLIGTLSSRRVPMGEAAAAIEAYAAAQPQDKRDQALKLLFAGLLSSVNSDRAVVMRGIERFQKRQKARAAEIERQGEAIRQLREKAAADATARIELAAAEDRYNWDVRVFTERQQALPLACEIPVLIEQRLFELAREIRQRMHD
ncbi:MAG TPA: hypothetical protein VG758_03145 [Hyphomicrobiaceae bacterium]|jgi:hypothetical protein|nr:hypothetical protein [Hyphomicrobiaceae bacterium]